jgi:N-acetylglucosaminyldiphosphoundecaprenol N-acetyl-beta-D-mannosaminyltransferase
MKDISISRSLTNQVERSSIVMSGHDPSGSARRRPFRLHRRPEERVTVLGVVVDLVKAAEIFHYIDGAIRHKRAAVIANHNLHSLYLVRQCPELRRFFNTADLVEVDSIPLILWARLIGRQSRRFHRCTYLDWRDEFWGRVAARGWRVFFVGGAPGVAEMARQAIMARWPGVELATHSGYFDVSESSAENAKVIETINSFQPDILLVGMGMPRQELWVLKNQAHIVPCVIFTVGGAFDYEAGVQRAPPRWVGQVGAEWAYRLALNPRRMFKRYCVEPWSLIGPALSDINQALSQRILEVRSAASSGERFAALRPETTVRDQTEGLAASRR